MGGVSRFTPEELAKLKEDDSKLGRERRNQKRPDGRTLKEHESEYSHQYYLDHKAERQAYDHARWEKKKAARLLEQSNGTGENILTT